MHDAVAGGWGCNFNCQGNIIQNNVFVNGRTYQLTRYGDAPGANPPPNGEVFARKLVVAPLHDSRYAFLKVDAGYGAIRPADTLVASPTAGHAMRAVEPTAGVVVGRAIDGLDGGVGTIRVLLVLR